FCWGLRLRDAQNFAVCPLCAHSCHLEHHCAHVHRHDDQSPRRFLPQNGFTWPKNRPSLDSGRQGKALPTGDCIHVRVTPLLTAVLRFRSTLEGTITAV